MRKDQIIWAHGIKAMAACLKTEVNKLREQRRQAVGMLRNSEYNTADWHTANGAIISIDNEIKEWNEAYKKVTAQPDFS